MATTFTDANFDTEVLKHDQLTVVDFWAPWCGPCVGVSATMDILQQEYAGKVKIGKVNVADNPNVSIEYGITNMPVVLFIKNGQVVDKHVGAAPKNVYEKKIKEHL